MLNIIFHLYKNDITLYERKNIIQEVIEFHRENGGYKTEINNLWQVKKALQSISPSYIKNPKTGYWQFIFNEETDYNSFYNPKKKNNLTAYSNSDIKNIKKGWIYFYYYPSYKELSEFKNEVNSQEPPYQKNHLYS